MRYLLLFLLTASSLYSQHTFNNNMLTVSGTTYVPVGSYQNTLENQFFMGRNEGKYLRVRNDYSDGVSYDTNRGYWLYSGGFANNDQIYITNQIRCYDEDNWERWEDSVNGHFITYSNEIDTLKIVRTSNENLYSRAYKFYMRADTLRLRTNGDVESPLVSYASAVICTPQHDALLEGLQAVNSALSRVANRSDYSQRLRTYETAAQHESFLPSVITDVNRLAEEIDRYGTRMTGRWRLSTAIPPTGYVQTQILESNGNTRNIDTPTSITIPSSNIYTITSRTPEENEYGNVGYSSYTISGPSLTSSSTFSVDFYATSHGTQGYIEITRHGDTYRTYVTMRSSWLYPEIMEINVPVEHNGQYGGHRRVVYNRLYLTRIGN